MYFKTAAKCICYFDINFAFRPKKGDYFFTFYDC